MICIGVVSRAAAGRTGGRAGEVVSLREEGHLGRDGNDFGRKRGFR